MIANQVSYPPSATQLEPPINPSTPRRSSSLNLTLYQHHLHMPWQDNLPDLDSEKTLVLIFAAPEYRQRPEIFQQIKKHFSKSYILGCSSAGEIFQDTLSDSSLGLAALRFKHSELASAYAHVDSAEDSFQAGQFLALKLNTPQEGKRLKGIFLLSDGLSVNGSELVRGLKSTLGSDVVIAGGLAGDGGSFKSTWLIVDGELRDNMVTAVGFYGEQLELSCASKGGWDIFGPERRVSRSHANVLYELDGQPALELYKRYLGDLMAELPASALRFPLAIKEKSTKDKLIVRTVLSVDEASQSLTFAGDVPQGSVVQLMKANFDRLIDGAAEAALNAYQTSPDVASLNIAISCVGRRLVLDQRIEEELEVSLENLGPLAQQLGFYSYGEISSHEGSCDLHNQTMTLTRIVEWDSVSSPASSSA
ncbi:MAG: FIST N-terminal domain-containing protein [Deinococcales bacterium]